MKDFNFSILLYLLKSTDELFFEVNMIRSYKLFINFKGRTANSCIQALKAKKPELFQSIIKKQHVLPISSCHILQGFI